MTWFGQWDCKGCGGVMTSERELERHVSRNWPKCGTKTEANMAAKVIGMSESETTNTWEHGKLKVVLTRKSEGGRKTEHVKVINKGNGSFWEGTPYDFDDFAQSVSLMHVSVREELNPTVEAAPARCGCPTQHSLDCPG